MIFVTIGTETYPFDRLLQEVDSLQGRGIIKEDVFLQIGSSGYPPKHGRFADFLSYEEMMEKFRQARIVITHGGPGSIMPVLYEGKIPIVMPRRKKYGEVVDDHQLSFSRKLRESGKIILAESAAELEDGVKNYDSLVAELTSRTENGRISAERNITNFAGALETICRELLQKKKSRKSKAGR